MPYEVIGNVCIAGAIALVVIALFAGFGETVDFQRALERLKVSVICAVILTGIGIGFLNT